MTKALIIILLLFSILGCKKELKLSKQKYTDVILDLQVAETAISNSNEKNKDSLRKIYHKRVCEIYGFKDVSSLKSALEPLREDPELMLEITKSMSALLDKLADSALTAPTKPE